MVATLSNTAHAGQEVSERKLQKEAQLPIVSKSAAHAQSACGAENLTCWGLRNTPTKPASRWVNASDVMIGTRANTNSKEVILVLSA